MSKEFKDCYSSTDSIKIGSKTFIIGEPSIGDIISFQNWCDKEIKKEVKDLEDITGVKPTPKEAREFLKDPELRNKIESSFEGQLKIVTSMMIRLNKDVDEDYFKANLTAKVVEKITEIINSYNEEEKNPPINFPVKKKSKKKTS